MMDRTQISLDHDLRARAKERAAEMGVSLAEYIRRLIARDLGSQTPHTDPSAVFDLGDSGGSDIARDRDRATGEAVEAGRSRNR